MLLTGMLFPPGVPREQEPARAVQAHPREQAGRSAHDAPHPQRACGLRRHPGPRLLSARQGAIHRHSLHDGTYGMIFSQPSFLPALHLPPLPPLSSRTFSRPSSPPSWRVAWHWLPGEAPQGQEGKEWAWCPNAKRCSRSSKDGKFLEVRWNGAASLLGEAGNHLIGQLEVGVHVLRIVVVVEGVVEFQKGAGRAFVVQGHGGGRLINELLRLGRDALCL